MAATRRARNEHSTEAEIARSQEMIAAVLGLDDTLAGPGHNQPPEPIDVTLVTSDAGVLQARLERDYSDMLDRFVELELGAAKVPAQITTEAEAKTTVAWIGDQCKALITLAADAHTKEKKPYWEAGKVVDRFFNDPINHLSELLGLDRKTRIRESVMGRVQQYYDAARAAQRQREEAARRLAHQTRAKAEAEARRLAEEAKRSEAAGDRTKAVELTRLAEREQTNAAVAAAQAEAPPVPVTIRGEYGGSTAFAVEKWDYEVVNWAAVPRGFLTIDDSIVREAINEGVRDIPGLRIFQADRFIIKRC